MMKRILIAIMVGSCLVTGHAMAAEKTAQQQKMTVCNHQASTNSLKGDDRKSFMSHCLKKESNRKKLTTQQQKMKTCNADAKSKNMQGSERKLFMRQCLKK